MLKVIQSPDTLIPFDLYNDHSPLSITFPCSSVINNTHSLYYIYHNFKRFDYKNTLDDLVSMKWDDLYLNEYESANLLQKTTFSYNLKKDPIQWRPTLC